MSLNQENIHTVITISHYPYDSPNEVVVNTPAHCITVNKVGIYDYIDKEFNGTRQNENVCYNIIRVVYCQAGHDITGRITM